MLAGCVDDDAAAKAVGQKMIATSAYTCATLEPIAKSFGVTCDTDMGGVSPENAGTTPRDICCATCAAGWCYLSYFSVKFDRTPTPSVKTAFLCKIEAPFLFTGRV